MPNERRTLILLLGVVFLSRLAYAIILGWHNPSGFFLYDSWQYLNLGYNMFHHGTFSLQADYPQILDATRTPGYPFLIYALHAMKSGVLPLIMLQSALATATTWLIYLLGIRLSKSNGIALLAALIYAFDVPSLVLTSVVMTDTLYTFLLILWLHYMLENMRGKWIHVFIAGVIFSIACYVKPVSLPLLGVIVSAGLLIRALRPFVLKFVIMSAVVAFAISPWLVRNNQQFGETFYTSIPQLNLLFHHAAEIDANNGNISIETIRNNYREEMTQVVDVKNPNHVEEFRLFAKEKSWSVIADNTGQFVVNWIKWSTMSLIVPMKGTVENQWIGQSVYCDSCNLVGKLFFGTPLLLLIPILMNMSMMLALIPGLVLFVFRKGMKGSPERWLAFLLVLYFVFAFGSLHPEARFRVPIYPIICILGLMGLMNVKSDESAN